MRKISILLFLVFCHNLIFSSVSGNPGHLGLNQPKLNSSYGAGHVEELGGLKAYVSGSFHSKSAVLLISDIFGYETPKLRKLADKVASAGFYAVVPDYFRGDPFNPNDTARPLEVWLKDHTPEKGFEDSKPIIEALKYKGLTSIGAAGFCWGAKVAVELSKSIAFVQAEVLLHPSFVSVDDIKALKVATSILGAEKDVVSPPALVKQFAKALEAKPEFFTPDFGNKHEHVMITAALESIQTAYVPFVWDQVERSSLDWERAKGVETGKALCFHQKIDSFVKIFRGVEHGWTIRYEDGDKFAVRSARKAHRYMIRWFAKHLK